MKKPVILITGASGFTGRHACRYFAGNGMEVVALVRSPGKVEPGKCGENAASAEGEPAIRQVVCDLLDQRHMKEVVQEIQPDYLLHLAGRNSVSDSWTDPEAALYANLLATLHVLEGVRTLKKPPRVLVVGSMLSFTIANPPAPPHPYSLSKTLQVLLARSWSHLFQLPIMAAEPSNLVGPGPSTGICGLLARKIVQWERGKDTEPFRMSSVTEKRDYLDVRDAVAAYSAILLHGTPGELYRFGSGTFRTLGEVLETYRTIAGRELPFVIGGASTGPEPRPIPMKSVLRLGWRPEVPFEQSLRDVLHYFRQEGGSPE